MPNYLSQGSQHFNQARRIHPKDPVAQLDYYLPSSSVSLASTSLSNSSAELRSPVNSTLSRRHTRASARKVTLSSPELLGDGHSPFNSSGFSEDTLVEASVRANYPKQAHQIGLGDSGPYKGVSNSKRRYETKNIEFNASSSGSFSSASGRGGNVASADKQARHQTKGSALKRSAVPSLAVNQQQQFQQHGQPNMSRLKRRNINRINRRMMTLGVDGGLGNPYALSELFSQSEIPGFREIFASDSYLRKFCWIVAFLIMTILSLNDMTTLITEFYDYPITVDVRLRDSARLPFPSVTVCNLNVVRSSSLCSSSATSKFDMTNKIPSEMRDKLCGIQVEKKNTTESDINDINNIGITSTTTTSTTTKAPATSTPTAGATTNSPALSTTPSGGGAGSATTQTGSESPGKQPVVPTVSSNDGSASSTTPSGTNNNNNNSGNGQAEHGGDKTTNANGNQAEQTTTPAPSSSTRRPPGALDLGDFANPALLMDRRARISRQEASSSRRRSRSIKLADYSNQQPDDDRPFASSKSRVRVRQSPVHSTTDSNQEFSLRKILNPSMNSNNNNNKQQLASQFNKAGPNNVMANRVTNQMRGGFQVPNNNNNLNLNNNINNNNNNNNNNKEVNTNNINLINSNNVNPFAYSTPGSTLVPQINNSSTFNMPIISEDFELTERQERELQENLTNWLAVMNQRDSQFTWSLGHQFDDMILRCTMKSINCTHQRSFEKHFSPTEGNCFTYRSRVKRKAGSNGEARYEEANLAGTNHGLELVLNLEKNEYISGSSQVGALVMIHHPSDLGYAASEATFIAPEYTTYIGLKMVNITRLPAPHPEYCVDNWPSKFADKMTRNNTYSQQACLKICLQKTIQSHCQCQSAFLPIVELDSQPQSSDSSSAGGGASSAGSSSSGSPGSNGPGDGSSVSQSSANSTQHNSQQPRIIICDTRKSHTRQCVREVMFRAADRVHNCECPPKCQVIRYDKTISMARWPTNEDKVTFDRGKMDINFQNLAKVIVYFQTMTCEEVTQQAVYSPAKLFSALGGIMGMYVGFSFLSVFEIFEVMSRKLWHYFTVKLYNSTSRLRAA